jgi:hypothetical protein
MRPVLQAVSFAALAATILPAILYFNGALDLDSAKGWMLVGTAAWFVATPAWMGRGD